MERQLSYSIKAFPSPPSVNRLYAYKAGRVRKTQEYRSYEREVSGWAIRNQPTIKELRAFFVEIGPLVIHVDSVFNMSKSSILCLNGKPKRNDTSNMIKALHDVLAAVIGVDDSYFWSGAFNKVAITDSAVTEDYVDIEFKLRTI